MICCVPSAAGNSTPGSSPGQCSCWRCWLPGRCSGCGRLGLIGGLLGAVLTLVVVPLEWRGLRYRIGRECLRVSGVLVRRTTLLPLDRVTEVRIVAGPVDRLFGVHSVLLRTPGASLLLPGLTGEEAAALAALALEGGGEG